MRVVLCSAVLTGCSATGATVAAPAPAVASATGGPTAPTTSAPPIQLLAPTVAVVPPVTPGAQSGTPPSSLPVPMAADTTTESFAISPAFTGGASGRVTVSATPQTARYHIVVTGLTAGSAHAIHDHLGSCRDAAVSQHLRTIAVVTADRAGMIVIDASLPAFDAGAGRIVLVYASASPSLISGCAQL